MRRHFGWLLACLLISVTYCGRTGAADDPNPRVKLETGILEGTRFAPSQGNLAFLGVPYAAPPLGELRWKPPQPANHWSGVRSATRFSAPCPQLPAKWFRDIGWNEDCLYLNIWTSQLSGNEKKAVLVYFHGGSNTQGYSQMDPLGPPLSRLGVVVVSANYRLGPFGFLAHPALTGESEHHSSGNYGLLDQLQALKWVRDNISHFGGDPARVTVMGQSAGAVDVCLLMASPLAAGLFEGAIMESGECQSTLNEDIRSPISYNSISGTGEAVGQRLAKDLGVPDTPDILQKLRSIPAGQILKTWSQDREVHFEAIVDGWVIPEQPTKIFADGKQMHIPVLVGSDADEATVFGHNDVKTVAQYREYLRQDTGKYSDQELQAYSVSSDADVPERYLQLQNDSFAYGAYSLAQSTSDVNKKAYLYYFTYADTGKRARLGAHHGEELFFLSRSFPADWEHNSDDDKFGELIRTYWTQFAKTGNPNIHGCPDWPDYSERPNQYFELGRGIGPRTIAPRLRVLEIIMKQIAGRTVSFKLKGSE
jgi:para-nitrobenzyl esterase